MTKQEYDILRIIFEWTSSTAINTDIYRSLNENEQKSLIAKLSGHSPKVTETALKALIQKGYLDKRYGLTQKAVKEHEAKSPQNAIILAAGFGMRMVPINLTTPKGLLEVAGEPLIERIIKQLHEVSVTDITVVVGFMKEKFSYLEDKYGVSLVENPGYASKNNLSSLALAADKISNTYIIPSDIWCDANPFSGHEMHSWYMVSDLVDDESYVRLKPDMTLEAVPKGSAGNGMIGIAYILEEDAILLRRKLKYLSANPRWDDQFWELALYDHGKIKIPARVVHSTDADEINTYEQLRELDGESNQLKSEALDVIASVFGVSTNDIVDISVLKKGMTNRSFLFSVGGKKYIMRIPGEGTDKLISRENEALVYRAISGKGLCDDPVYINPENGYKITRFLEGIRCADAENVRDLKQCMHVLKKFHEMKLTVPHTFDIFGQIRFYEELWEGQPSIYKDYEHTRDNVMSLQQFINDQPKEWTLTHIDAVPDNFLFYDQDGRECLQLTDWEYAGMQDPHVDIAMFCIYSYYNKRQVDRLINIYFDGKCDRNVRAKIYCYIAACGLLWSNWSEYKRWLSVDFSEYSKVQYKYAKDYYKYALREMKEDD